MSDCGYRSLRAGARATALSALLPRGCGGAPAGYRRHRNVVLLRKSLVKAAHPKLLRVSGGGSENYQYDYGVGSQGPAPNSKCW